MSEVVPRLWLGGAGEAKELSAAADMVVNCTCDLPFWNPMAYNVRLAVKDNGERTESVKLFDMLEDDEVFEAIHAALSAGKRVLVHCRAGEQRSAAVVACYVVWRWRMDPLDAIAYVRSKRPEAFLGGANFMDAILHYAKACG